MTDKIGHKLWCKFSQYCFTLWDICTNKKRNLEGAENDKRTVRPHMDDAFIHLCSETFNGEALFELWQQYECFLAAKMSTTLWLRESVELYHEIKTIQKYQAVDINKRLYWTIW